ncbi:MAG TPA: DUF4350 domain-containing protein [Allocoleopsis sp.]
MKLSQRRLWLFGAIAIGVIVLITILAAPANQKVNSGSTYGRAPDGYGAWYAFMEQRGTPVRRWQKPFEEFAEGKDAQHPITLLRVNSGLGFQYLSSNEENWVKRGNTLVVLGVRDAVTEAPFSTRHSTEAGTVKIDTTRRHRKDKGKRLSDRFGAIVWQESMGQGKVIYSTTPYLAANAYQDFPGNYEFLARLVTPEGAKENSSSQNRVWVDEYIHRYKDVEVIKRESGQSVSSYLAKTPLFPAFVQGLLIFAIAIWAANRRFGKPLTLSAPVVDNSEAYIQALAGVLQKANSSEFVLEVVGKEEQLQLQKALFLGDIPLDSQSLVSAWVQQTGRPATELEQLLQAQSRKHRMSEIELLTWLDNWEKIRRYLPSYRTDR